jgi:AcrR family transcriptional regulator
MRQRILDVAMELFLDRGYGSTSIRDIAERLGVSKAAVYYHFPAKEQLASALLKPALDSLGAVADGVAAGRLTPPQALAELASGHAAGGRIMTAMRQDPSLQEAARATQAQGMAEFERIARALAGPRPSQAGLVRAHSALGALFAGLGSASKYRGAAGPNRAESAAAIEAALAALNS